MRLKPHVMARRVQIAFWAASCFVVGLPAAQALNYNEEGSVSYLDSVTNDIRLKVGIDEPDNTLYLTNGAVVSISKGVYVGDSSSSTNNLLRVSGGGQLFVGNVNTNNAGAGGIYVGDTTGKGELLIDNQSFVETDYLYLGAGSDETGLIEVSGDSSLTVDEQIYVGANDNSDNVLNLSDGGALFIHNTSDLIISNIAGATNHLNEVNVASGGKLLVGGDVNATGFTSVSNLNFESGAVLGVGGALTIDEAAIENGLNIWLDNALSTNQARWIASEMYVGDETSDNVLVLTNGALASASDIIYVGNEAAADDNRLIVAGSNSVLTAGAKLLVGNKGSDNTLVVQNGGTVNIAQDLKLGVSDGAEGNSVSVGTNSSLKVTRNLVVGGYGDDNSLTAEDGAAVSVSGEFVVGQNSAGNSVNILSSNTVFTVAGDVEIGRNGDGNYLNIQQGQATFAQALTIGGDADSNYVTVAGSNALLKTRTLIVGDEGDDNYLKLTDGGTVWIESNAVLGVSGDDNYISMSGSNSTITVMKNLTVGETGDGNALSIKGGTFNVAENLYLGADADSEENTITISGQYSTLAVSNTLYVGSSSSSNNSVVVENGGTLFAGAQQNIVMGSASNNLLTVADGGTLKTYDWDYDAVTNTATNIVFESGAALHLLGTLTGTNQVEGGLSYILDGTNATWNSSTNIYVGCETDGNSLILTNGACMNAVSNLYLGFLSGDNLVTLSGTGSVLTVGNDLFIGSTSNSITCNTVEVLDSASLVVSNNAALYGGTLKIDSSSHVTVLGDYSQDEYSTLVFGLSSNQTSPSLYVQGSVSLTNSANTSKYPAFSVYDDGIGETNIVTIVQAGSITVDGEAATACLLEDNIVTNLLLDFDVTVSNSDTYSYIILNNFIRQSIAQAAGLDGQLASVADQIDGLYDIGDANADEMMEIIETSMTDETELQAAMDNYYGEKMSSVPANIAINTGVQSFNEQLTRRVDSTRSRIGLASAESVSPSGAEGPHVKDQELQGWITKYKSWISQSSTGGYDGYDGSVNGFMLGADFTVGDGLLLGFAGGAGSASIGKDNGGGTDTDTTFGSVYASTGTKDWFADASLILGMSSVDTTLGSTFDTTGAFDARNVAVYFGGGKEIIGQYLVFTPQASLLANYYAQDGYTESSTTAVARQIGSASTFYLQSSLGCNVAGYHRISDETTMKGEARAFWMHEFNAREEDLDYRLVGGNSQYYTLQMQAPESDVIKIGFGISMIFEDSAEFRVDLDSSMAGSYTDHTLSGTFRVRF